MLADSVSPYNGDLQIDASELQGNHEEMFPHYIVHIFLFMVEYGLMV